MNHLAYIVTVRTPAGKPFARRIVCSAVEFKDWWAIFWARLEDGGTEVVAAVSSDNLLCIELEVQK